jgi:hypothetical protein
VQEVAGSNPVAPTIFLKKPFGQQAEGLSHCGDKTCAVERAVQTEDFEDSTFCVVVSGKPFLSKALRKFKRFHRNVDDFVPATVGSLDFQLQLSGSISQVSVRRGEYVGVDLFEHPQVEQAVLLVTNLHQFVLKLLGSRR